MAGAFPRLDTVLETLRARGRYRALMPRAGHDFASNDYLGISEDPVMKKAGIAALERDVPVGAGGSRLLRGNASEHEALEREAAQFFQTEAALFMGGGFPANLAIFSTLPQQGDLVLYDALIHASTHDGMRLGRAENRPFKHNDLGALSKEVQNWRQGGGAGLIWIAVEAVYSMDGDTAPLQELRDFAAQENAVLVIDEAHSTGVFGDQGRGLAHEMAHEPNILSLHTCGKALGVSGALICGSKTLVEMLINKARSFIYATAPSPLNAALVRAALHELRDNPARRDALWDVITHAHGEAARLCGLSGFESQILPIIIGDDKATLKIAQKLQDQGYDIRAIRPPTVPRGTSRLRISITLNVDKATITTMFDAVARELEAIK